jgi:hypothetical protein
MCTSKINTHAEWTHDHSRVVDCAAQVANTLLKAHAGAANGKNRTNSYDCAEFATCSKIRRRQQMHAHLIECGTIQCAFVQSSHLHKYCSCTLFGDKRDGTHRHNADVQSVHIVVCCRRTSSVSTHALIASNFTS